MWDKIEELFLFKGMRFAGGVIAAIFVILILIMVWPPSKPAPITYSAVKNALNEKEESRSTLNNYRHPKALSKESLGEDNYKVVMGWIENAPQKYQQSTADTLAKVYKKALKKGNDTPEILNKYRDLQNERLTQLMAIEGNVMARNLKYFFAIGLFMCLVLICNLLVLIKISQEKKSS